MVQLKVLFVKISTKQWNVPMHENTTHYVDTGENYKNVTILKKVLKGFKVDLWALIHSGSEIMISVW